MPATLQVINRYIRWDNVGGAAVTIDQEAVTAKTPRTAANGYVKLPTEGLADGAHVLHVIPSRTSTVPVGPALAEDVGPEVERMFRSLDVNITIRKGSIDSATVPTGQAENGEVGVGTNPRVIKLQPVYYRSPHQNAAARRAEDINLILVHQTAGSANIGGTLNYFKQAAAQASAHYVMSAEPVPQAVKVVQETGRSWQAGRHTWWAGDAAVNNNSIGIEMSHKAGTAWPKQQITALIKFLELLLKAHPNIKRHQIVGHMDVLTDAQHMLIGRDCPGLEFDWPELEKEGLGLVPTGGGVSLDGVYGGFFRVNRGGRLQAGDRDSTRQWGAKPWKLLPAAQAAAGAKADAQVTKAVSKVAGKQLGIAIGDLAGGAAAALAETVSGEPVKELQTDLRSIGYAVEVTGHFDYKTAMAVKMFQQHFFAGSRRGMIDNAERGKVGGTTAEYIKRVRT